MKKLFLLGAMVCVLGMMTANVSAQNVTESDIVGKWEFSSLVVRRPDCNIPGNTSRRQISGEG
jgi:hypothetical protein